jgi:hypothetical protein
MKTLENTKEMVIFQYDDGSYQSWIKAQDPRWGNTFGHRDESNWQGNPKHPDPVEYTRILEMADYIPAISSVLEKLMLLYTLNKED